MNKSVLMTGRKKEQAAGKKTQNGDTGYDVIDIPDFRILMEN